MEDIWQQLQNADKPILLYGTGNGADKILDRLNAINVQVQGVFASDGYVRRRTYRGFEVLSLEEAEARFGDFVALFAFGSNRAEVLDNIKRIMTRHTLLAPEVPVCGDGTFNLSFARAHSTELREVYNILADEQSKKVFEQTVMQKLDGDINRLFSCETSPDEAFDSILKIKGGHFLDLGAYNGDTALDFASRVPKYSKITAIEPDRKTFAKLVRNTEALSIEAINAAVSDRCGKIAFSFKSSKGSVADGDGVIDAVTIDSLDSAFDYIKFDVEGEELRAIKGGRDTILRCRPKMLISCYHRCEDYFSIPKAVLDIRSDYRVYMRHYPAVPAWETSFYFV